MSTTEYVWAILLAAGGLSAYGVAELVDALSGDWILAVFACAAWVSAYLIALAWLRERSAR